MKQPERINRWLAFEIWLRALAAIALLIFMCHVYGCTLTGMKRTHSELVQPCQGCQSPQEVISECTTFFHLECLMRSRMDNAEVLIDGDYRHYYMESRVQSPDPNTTQIIKNGVVTGVGL